MGRTDNHRETLIAALIWVGVVAAVLLLWAVKFALVVSFAAVLLAILIRALTRTICRIGPVDERMGVAAATLAVLLVAIVTIGLGGWQIASQFHQMLDHLHQGEMALAAWLRGNRMPALANETQRWHSDALHKGVSGFFSTGLRILEAVVVFLISAIYLAVRPKVYRRGFARLFPQALRDSVVEGLESIGISLELWLFAQLIMMLIVAVLSFFALSLIGVPGASILALIAGLTEIIPYLGPFIGAAPALLVAITGGLEPVLWTAASYLGIHLIEGYLVGPLLQRHFIVIPPALILIGIFTAGLLFGPAGIVIGAPLTAAVFIAVKVFYIRDVLNERAEVPKESPF